MAFWRKISMSKISHLWTKVVFYMLNSRNLSLYTLHYNEINLNLLKQNNNDEWHESNIGIEFVH